jgi:protein-disulfide isomerase
MVVLVVYFIKGECFMKQNLLQYAMVAMIVVGAYFIGVYKTENSYLKQGGALNQAPSEFGQDPTEFPEEKTVLTEDEWQKAKSESVGQMGEKDAPVTIVEWTDYQCPFCKRYVDDTFDQIKENFIDTGKVRYEVRDLILPFHPNAKPAAIAARCAAKEGKFWEMHDKLFETQATWSNLSDTKDEFGKYASELGISSSKFASCVADPSVAAGVDADTQVASEIGASGTPTFVVNGALVVGAQPYQVFEQAINEMLN